MSDTGRKTVRPTGSHLIAFRIRVPARLLVKLAKQNSPSPPLPPPLLRLLRFLPTPTITASGLPPAIAYGRREQTRGAKHSYRPIITQRSEADRTRASPAAPVASSLANGKNGPETCLYYE